MSTTLYQILRAAFLIGNAASLALIFAPTAEVTSFWSKQVLTGYDIMNQLAQNGSFGLFIFILLLVVVAPILSIILALVRPQRWVFLSSASVAAFGILFGFFAGSNPGVRLIPEVEILGYVASVMVMVGFIMKPPRSATTERVVAA